MGHQYKKITAEQIHIFFKNINTKKNRTIWKQIYPPLTQEIVYATVYPKTNFELRVYTSVHITNNVSRPIGKDAIRIHIYDTVVNGIVKSANRTNRNGSILKKIESKAKKLWIEFKPSEHKCPNCGGTLLIKHGKYGDFLGCSNHTINNCKFTKPLPCN